MVSPRSLFSTSLAAVCNVVSGTQWCVGPKDPIDESTLSGVLSMLGKHFGVQESVMLTFRHQLEQNSGELIETLQQCIESNAETTKTSLDLLANLTKSDPFFGHEAEEQVAGDKMASTCMGLLKDCSVGQLEDCQRDLEFCGTVRNRTADRLDECDGTQKALSLENKELRSKVTERDDKILQLKYSVQRLNATHKGADIIYSQATLDEAVRQERQIQRTSCLADRKTDEEYCDSRNKLCEDRYKRSKDKFTALDKECDRRVNSCREQRDKCDVALAESKLGMISELGKRHRRSDADADAVDSRFSSDPSTFNVTKAAPTHHVFVQRVLERFGYAKAIVNGEVEMSEEDILVVSQILVNIQQEISLPPFTPLSVLMKAYQRINMDAICTLDFNADIQSMYQHSMVNRHTEWIERVLRNDRECLNSVTTTIIRLGGVTPAIGRTVAELGRLQNDGCLLQFQCQEMALMLTEAEHFETYQPENHVEQYRECVIRRRALITTAIDSAVNAIHTMTTTTRSTTTTISVASLTNTDGIGCTPCATHAQVMDQPSVGCVSPPLALIFCLMFIGSIVLNLIGLYKCQRKRNKQCVATSAERCYNNRTDETVAEFL